MKRITESTVNRSFKKLITKNNILMIFSPTSREVVWSTQLWPVDSTRGEPAEQPEAEAEKDEGDEEGDEDERDDDERDDDERDETVRSRIGRWSREGYPSLGPHDESEEDERETEREEEREGARENNARDEVDKEKEKEVRRKRRGGQL